MRGGRITREFRPGHRTFSGALPEGHGMRGH